MKKIFICSVLAISTMSCHAQEVTPGKPEVLTKELATAKPEALIQDLYETKEDVFLSDTKKELSAKFLASTLIKLLALDAKRAEGEVGAIDFDVLTYSQDDSKITKFTTQAEVKGDTSIVKTSFENHGERIVIKFHCVKEDGQWRIADVSYEDGTSLVKLLTASE